VIGSIFFIFDIGVISCVKERFYFVCIGQVNDQCPICWVVPPLVAQLVRHSFVLILSEPIVADLCSQQNSSLSD
jgi:hypothetical protein